MMPSGRLSSYPNGFRPGALIQNVPVVPAHGAKVFYVGNNTTLLVGEKGASDGNKGGFYDPFLTIEGAQSQAVTNRGDVIYVRDGFTTTLDGSTTVTLTKNNLKVIGLGTGSKRPTLTVGSSATASVTLSGNDILFKNFLIISALDGLNSAVTISGSGCDVDIEHRDTSSTVEADIAVTITGDNVNLRLKDVGQAAGDQREASVQLEGSDNSYVWIDQKGLVATGVVNLASTACLNLSVEGRVFTSVFSGARNVVDTVGGSTWTANLLDGMLGTQWIRSSNVGNDTAFMPGLGYHVSKSGVTTAVNTDVFTGTGVVLITALWAEITTVVSATATNFNLRVKTDNIGLCAATAIEGDADGTLYMMGGDADLGLDGGDTPTVRMAHLSGLDGGILVGNAGVAFTIETLFSAAVDTGAMTIHAHYIPVVAGASLVAA